jgi:pyruvate kinase
VLASVGAVRIALQALASYPGGQGSVDAESAIRLELLAAHTEALLGPAPANRRVRIMVTMPSNAARDYSLVHELVRKGMNCMRINCAHEEVLDAARSQGGRTIPEPGRALTPPRGALIPRRGMFAAPCG